MRLLGQPCRQALGSATKAHEFRRLKLGYTQGPDGSWSYVSKPLPLPRQGREWSVDGADELGPEGDEVELYDEMLRVMNMTSERPE